MAEPPSLVIEPPDTAVLLVIDVADTVDRMGTTQLVLNSTELPYEIPAELIAYARA